ncbi:MAG: hypothetical protein ACXW1D_00760 [Halobacteriota archaeon]
MNKLKKWVSDIVTEPDGKTVCPIRCLAILGFLWALCMNGWSVIALKAVFDITAFGGSYAVMLAALGVALGMKTDSTKEA